MRRTTVRVNPQLKRLEELFVFDDRLAQAALDNVDRWFVGHEKKVFATEGSEGGEPWPQLSPAYAAEKPYIAARLREGRRKRTTSLTTLAREALSSTRKKARKAIKGLKILELTGDMKRAYTQRSNKDHLSEAIRRNDGEVTLRVGTTLERAQYHAKGGDRLPRRPPVQVTQEQLQGPQRAMLDAFAPQLKRILRILQTWKGR